MLTFYCQFDCHIHNSTSRSSHFHHWNFHSISIFFITVRKFVQCSKSTIFSFFQMQCHLHTNTFFNCHYFEEKIIIHWSSIWINLISYSQWIVPIIYLFLFYILFIFSNLMTNFPINFYHIYFLFQIILDRIFFFNIFWLFFSV